MLSALDSCLIWTTLKVAWPSWKVSYAELKHKVFHPDKLNNKIDWPAHPNSMGMDTLLWHMDDTMIWGNDVMIARKKNLKT